MPTTVTVKVYFEAAHRLHNPDKPDDWNRRVYGKCNNPHGHGHNYVLEVSVVRPSNLSLVELWQYARYLQNNDLDSVTYEMALWNRIANVVAVPLNLKKPAPVGIHLHCWGASLNNGYGWWYKGDDGHILIASNQIPYDWWTGYHELARAKVLAGRSWVMPVLANGRIYAKNNDGKIVCVDVRANRGE